MNSQQPSRNAKAAYYILTGLLVLALVAGTVGIVDAAVGIARGGERPILGKTLRVNVQPGDDALKSFPRGMELTSDSQATIKIEDPTSKQVLLSTLLWLFPGILLVIGLWLLRSVAQSVFRGDPFNAANVARLRSLGSLLVGGTLLLAFVSAGVRNALYTALPPDEFGDIGMRGWWFDGTPMLAGLGAFVLAEVFAHGLRLREDVEATV